MGKRILLFIMLMLLFLGTLLDVMPICFAVLPRKLETADGLVDRPSVKRPPTSTVVDIRSLGNGGIPDNIRQGAILDIVAAVSVSVSSVTYSIDGGQELSMSQWGSTDRYYASWTVTQTLGSHSVTVKAITSGKRPKTYTDSATVQVIEGYVAELWYEIDYMYDSGLGKDFKPSESVLNKWVAYWDARGITVHPVIDDAVPWQHEISDPWTLEAQYNDHEPHPDAPNWYNSAWKWMLWADYDVDHNVGGSTYVELTSSGDCLGGNYITIYKGMVDAYYGPKGLLEGGEVTVAMHEAGHSIGVARLQRYVNSWYEVYDSDYYSVMSTMRTENAGFTNHWYYSYNYWDTRNLDYY